MAIVLLGMVVYGEQHLKVDLTVRTLDYAKEKPIAGGRVVVTVRPPPQTASEQQGYYRFKRSVEAPKDLKTLRIEIQPPERYSVRTILLRRRPIERQKLTREVDAYLLQDGSEVTYRTLQEGKKLLEVGQFEKALAVFEYAFGKVPGDEITQYAVNVRYNYARSLLLGPA